MKAHHFIYTPFIRNRASINFLVSSGETYSFKLFFILSAFKYDIDIRYVYSKYIFYKYISYIYVLYTSYHLQIFHILKIISIFQKMQIHSTLLISLVIVSASAQVFPSSFGPFPAFGNNNLANPAWSTIFLTGATIPPIALKGQSAGSDLLTDSNNCGPLLNSWAFSIDDGPSEFSLHHNKYLKANNIPATYFMIGRQIPGMSDYVKSVADDPSFIVSMHTYTHRYLFSLSNDEIVAEVVWSAKAIYDATGRVPR